METWGHSPQATSTERPEQQEAQTPQIPTETQGKQRSAPQVIVEASQYWHSGPQAQTVTKSILTPPALGQPPAPIPEDVHQAERLPVPKTIQAESATMAACTKHPGTYHQRDLSCTRCRAVWGDDDIAPTTATPESFKAAQELVDSNQIQEPPHAQPTSTTISIKNTSAKLANTYREKGIIETKKAHDRTSTNCRS